MSDLREMFRRLRGSWGWIVAQFLGSALFIVVGLLWTRLPDKHLWQVALSLVVPLLLIISVLEMEAATMRAFADDDGARVNLPIGAITLLVWIAVAWVTWTILNWADDRIPLWAGYLNSRASAHWRATAFTYQHIQRGLIVAEWILRWVVVPGKLIPCAMASTQWGWRLHGRLILRVIFSWRWWPAVVAAALAAAALPAHLFAALPGGTVSAQVWHVLLKVGGSYLLVVGGWVLLLAWLAVLFSRYAPSSVRVRRRSGD